jgi:protein TonB
VGVEPPVFTKKVTPDYPDKAVKIRLQGYVILEAILRKDGSVDDIKILRGLGKGKFGFEEAAAQALKAWQFLPGKVNGKPADVRMTLKIDFVLQ